MKAFIIGAGLLVATGQPAIGQTFDATPSYGSSGSGVVPYSGWSSFSQQTLAPQFLTQANMQTQSDALRSTGLQAHGYDHVNVDSGWMGGFDGYGRPIPNTTTFPNITAMFDYFHRNGQKGGIYWIPGVEDPAVQANYPILGTPYHIRDILAQPYRAGNAFGGGGTSPYHYKIDFTKPGAQEYINSVVALFASWGVDFIKLDAVTPGSYSDDLRIDNRDDVAAWSRAITASSRPIWLTVSWQLDKDYLDVWQHYAQARRTDDDIECEGRCATMTNWPRIYKRLRDLPNWQDTASVKSGWNDLDALEIGNGATDGLTLDEKKTAFSFWSLANAPLYLGGDLTKLDAAGRQIATNDEILALDRSGHPARERIGGDHPVWVSDQGGGVYYVGLFNTNRTPEIVKLHWADLGLSGAVIMKDVWSGQVNGPSLIDYSSRVEGHGVRLFKIWAAPGFPQGGSTSVSYEADAAALSGTASIASCTGCTGGTKVGGLGLAAANSVTFNKVHAQRTGVYLMQIDSTTLGLRSLRYQINGGAFRTFNAGGSSFQSPSSDRLPVCLKAGDNVIRFGNPTSYAPDLDRIIISGDGRSALPSAMTFEAEDGQLGAGVTAGFSNYASGLSKAGNLGGGPERTVTFPNVTVASSGEYQLEVDYLTNGPRSFTITVDKRAAQRFTVNGSSFDDPATALFKVHLNAGTNVIQIGNDTGYAPDLDRLVVAPWLDNRVNEAQAVQSCS